MPVNTAKATRRPLHFKCLGCLKGELDRIDAAYRAGTLATSGNWTPGENLDHCAITFEIGLNGSGMKLGLVVRLVGRLLKGIITSDRPGAMRPGFKLPASAVELAPRPGVTFQEGMSRIRRAIGRLDAGERMTQPSPLLGALTHEQWVRLNLNHTQMHLGFLTYPGAPQQ